MVRFANPWFVVPALAVVALVLWRLRYLPRGFGSTGRRRAIQAVVLLATIAAALAFAGLEIGRRIDHMAVVFVLDRSRSVDQGRDEAELLASLRESAASMEAGDRAGLVVVAAEAATDRLPSPAPGFGSLRASVPRDATDLAAGLRRALADLPAEHAARVVLISDGVENRGDALAVASVASSRSVAVDVMPIERAPRPEVSVERVSVPATARPDEPIEVRVVTRSTKPTRARVQVRRDSEVIAEAQTELREGHDVLTLRDRAPTAGVHRYDVLITPLDAAHDAGRENNEGGSFLRVVGNSQALLVAEDPAGSEALAAAMRGSGMDVSVVDPARLPATLGELSGYDLIILSDVEARRLGSDTMEALQRYVRDIGGGLLMVGARHAFGLGGYAYTPVEEVLPATFDLRQRRDRLSLGMVIAIDKSGSMMMAAGGGRTKLDLANEAAARSAMLLSMADRVGVMHVDTAATWTQPMVSVEDASIIAGRVRAAQPGGGGIDVDVAMEAAYAALDSERTQLKHFLLFSDGEDSQQLEGTRQMVRRALQGSITTSIVSMGDGVYTPELEHLARIGEGRFYIVEDLRELPRIFTQETIEASRAAWIDGDFQATVAAPSPILRSVDMATAPPLEGYAVVNARPLATTVLEASDGDPLLAVWQHGVGRSAVFTTDVGARYGRRWLNWPGYAALFDPLGRSLARSPERSDAQVSLDMRHGRGHVRVEAIDPDGRYRNYLDLRMSVAGPGGEPVDLPLRQTGAGRYEGDFDANAPGPYLVTVRDRENGLVGSAGSVRPSGEELRGEGTNHALLAQLAALTGGTVRSDLTDVFRDRPPPVWAHSPMWPPLLMLSLCAMLLSVALRRLVLPSKWWSHWVWSRWRRPAAGRAPSAPATPAMTAAEQLRDARRRRQESTGDGQSGEAEESLANGDWQRDIAVSVKTSSPSRDASYPQSDVRTPSPASPPIEPTDAPASLAEKLLSRKKRKP